MAGQCAHLDQFGRIVKRDFLLGLCYSGAGHYNIGKEEQPVFPGKDHKIDR
jgi:hypothetical protein